MPKRFVDTDRYRKSLRGVDPKLRLAFHWLWENCDAAGVWVIDADLFRFECGYKLDVEGLLKTCPRLELLATGAIYLLDFIDVNYGVLKPGYNPHKPVFRSLEFHRINPYVLPGLPPPKEQIQDLPNPSPRVEEEGEEEGEDNSGKERAGGKVHEAVLWPSFNDWWNLYDKKSDRKKCEAKWGRILQQDRERMMEHTRLYVTQGRGSDPQFRRDPATYLNNENWNDEELAAPRTASNGKPTGQQLSADLDRVIAQRYGQP